MIVFRDGERCGTSSCPLALSLRRRMSQLQNPEKVDSPDPSPSPTLGENSDNDFDLKDDSADGPSENDQGVVGVFSSYRGFFEASEEEI